jgi:GNAT superfamily N-acetyltransferase
MPEPILSGAQLRLAQSGDIRAIRAVLAAAAHDLSTRFGEGHWSGVRSIETLRKYLDEGVLYVVENDERIIGTLRLTDQKIGFYRADWFTNPDDKAGYLLDMAIDPTRQRRGVGQLAMATCEDIARVAGLQAIRLDAYTGPAGAGEFYRRCGYRLMHQGAFHGVGLEYYEKLL